MCHSILIAYIFLIGNKIFVVTVDTTERCWLAYNVVMTLVRPRDKVICVFFHGTHLPAMMEGAPLREAKPIVEQLRLKYGGDMDDR